MAQVMDVYDLGTATVAADGTVVTITGGLLDDGNCIENDHIRSKVDGYSSPILERLGGNTFRVPAWKGTPLADDGYEIYPNSKLRINTGYLAARTQQLITRIDDRGVIWQLPAGRPSPLGLSANDLQFIYSKTLDKVWQMQSGSWVELDPDTLLFINKGPAGTIVIDTITTGAPGSAATVTNTGTPETAVLDIEIPRGDTGAAATIEFLPAITGAPGSAAAAVNTGDVHAANVQLTIPAGKGYGATSNSEQSISTGLYDFATQAGLAYVGGDRVHIGATSDPLNWLEGYVTAYVGNTITVNVTDNSGSGVFSSWGIGLTGKPGLGDGDMKGANNGADFVDRAATRRNVGIGTLPLKRDLSHLLRYHGKNVVVTGDSLSFNAYDFPVPAGAPVNAYDFYPGMMSWSFMLRDFAHRLDPRFVHADKIDWVSNVDAGTTAIIGPAAPYILPLGSRYVSIYGSKVLDDVNCMVRADNPDSDGLVLHWVKNPNAGNSGKVSVFYIKHPYTGGATLAGTISNDGSTLWGGFEPGQLFIPCGSDNDKPVKIIFSGFQTLASADPTGNMAFFIQGFGSKLTNFHLTGHGAYKASDILTDYSTRIGAYDPDLLIMIIGANDRATDTKETHASNLEAIITATRTTNPKCEIVILSPPPATDTGYGLDETLNGSTMREFLHLQKVTAERLGCIHVDCYELFERIDPAFWRHDNVHLTKRGNKVLFDAIVGQFFPGAREQQTDRRQYDPMQTAYSTSSFEDKKVARHAGSVVLTYADATTSYAMSNLDDADCALESVARGAFDYELVCTFRYPIRGRLKIQPTISPSVMHLGGSSKWIIARASAVSDHAIKYYLATR